MSTRSYIYIKIKPEDKGRVIKNPLAFAKKQGIKFRKGTQKYRHFEPFKVGDFTYIGIYSHFDGYINGGVGQELFTHYQDYEKILALISLGSMRVVADGDNISYHAMRCEGQNYIFYMCDILTAKDALGTVSYAYLYEGGKWYVTTWPDGKMFNNSVKWYCLEDILAQQGVVTEEAKAVVVD